MTLPGFTADASLYRSAQSYATISYHSTQEAGTVAPAFLAFCTFAGLACSTALLDGVPFDEIPICIAWLLECV
jgi:hypothetical protein